jgi:hypothetical protein
MIDINNQFQDWLLLSILAISLKKFQNIFLQQVVSVVSEFYLNIKKILNMFSENTLKHSIIPYVSQNSQFQIILLLM